MKRHVALGLILLACGVARPEETPSGKSLWVGTTPLFLVGMLQLEAEQKLEENSGVFAQGRWWATMTDGLVAGGQLAWHYHFSSFTRGFFIGPYVDVNRFEFDNQSDEAGYTATIAVAGAHWGGRYTFEKGAWIGFRLGAGVPFKTEFDRKHPDSEVADTLASVLDRVWLQPLLVSYSAVDASVSFGMAF